MRTLFATLFLLLFLAAPAAAQQDIVDQFEVRSQTHEGFTLPYRLFVPENYDPGTAYPLVLALHGAGERGTDNEIHIRLHRLATSWADPANQAEHPAFVVAPQAPPGGGWAGGAGFSNEERTVLAILDSLDMEFNIDPNRMYITGLSMGGHGTWDLITRLPDRFAAAVPMSGGGNPSRAAEILHMPLWVFHGESDGVVPAAGSRGILFEMEEHGRDVVYTDCRRSPPLETNFDCPGTMPGAELAERIDAHADLIYTGVRNGGHGPWNVWYDHPLLHDWLFAKYRVDPEAIAVAAPAEGAVWSGANEVTWTAPGPAGDSVEVWLSLNNGQTWERAGGALLGDGAYTLETTDYGDTPVARVRLFTRNQEGFLYGRATSAPFAINNEGDAPPFLYVDDEPLRFEPEVTDASLTLSGIAADPEQSPDLRLDTYYSIDGGTTFALVESSAVTSTYEPTTFTVAVDALPNSREAQLRFELSDDTHTVEVATATFTKASMRTADASVEHVQGEGTGTVTLHVVDPAAETGHRYRLTIDDANPLAKTYSVLDINAGETLLTGIPFSDGVRESPVFDGMTLVVQDPEAGLPDLEQTGWIEGDTDLGVTVTGGTVRIAILTVTLLDTEDEYELTVSESVADTSVAMFGFPAQELYFTVTARSDDRKRQVVFDDQNSDGLPGDEDVLYLLEPDAEGEPAPAWEFRFSADENTILPEAGDTFLFVPLPKLSAADVFEFGAPEGVGTEDLPAGAAITALTSYPNPFVDRATVAYRLAVPAHVTLEVYDVLGRRIAVLLDRAVEAGEHRLEWGGGEATEGLAAGVHFLRLTATPLNGGPERSLLRSVVRVR